MISLRRRRPASDPEDTQIHAIVRLARDRPTTRPHLTLRRPQHCPGRHAEGHYSRGLWRPGHFALALCCRGVLENWSRPLMQQKMTNESNDGYSALLGLHRAELVMAFVFASSNFLSLI